MNRTWEGQIRDRYERVQVTIGPDKELSVAREMHNIEENWFDADRVENQTWERMTYDIWVARFHDGSELLVEYWPEDDELLVAYRADRSNTWGRSVCFDEMVNQ